MLKNRCKALFLDYLRGDGSRPEGKKWTIPHRLRWVMGRTNERRHNERDPLELQEIKPDCLAVQRKKGIISS